MYGLSESVIAMYLVPQFRGLTLNIMLSYVPSFSSYPRNLVNWVLCRHMQLYALLLICFVVSHMLRFNG